MPPGVHSAAGRLQRNRRRHGRLAAADVATHAPGPEAVQWFAIPLLGLSGVYAYYARTANMDVPYLFWLVLAWHRLWVYLTATPAARDLWLEAFSRLFRLVSDELARCSDHLLARAASRQASAGPIVPSITSTLASIRR